MLVNGMVRVVKINVKWIAENAGGLLERNPMFFKITLGLFLIPLITHAVEYTIGVVQRCE
jgi:hypothetical protein